MLELSIITPCYRVDNLKLLEKSIKFDQITHWYIVYDTTTIPFVKRYNNPKITELEVKHKCCGAPQRNLGIEQIKSGFVYMLDDDNIIHDNFWELFKQFKANKIYTFDQERCSKNNKTVLLPWNNYKPTILPGNNYKLYKIDTAQFIVPRHLIDNQRWNISRCADGIFIEELYRRHPDKFVYMNKVGCWWNKLNPR